MNARVLLALALALAASSVHGQPPGGPGPGRPHEGRRAEAFRMVDAYVLSNLQESLALTDEQFTKALPLVRSLQAERREYLLARTRLLGEMRRLMRSGAASESQVVARLAELKALEADAPQRVKARAEDLDAALTPLQQAKFRLLELEVEQRMRELMARARRERDARRRDGGAPQDEPQP